ncbi:MAG: hypothetical protein H6729_15045 [Deltaproteobacteria bacterium]|nr:hypothetical protein [Deltaproteobacteria bacterium]
MMRRRSLRVQRFLISLAPWALVFSSACGLGAKDNFTRGLTHERCDGTFPVCQTTAGCVMGTGRYLDGQFPGSRRFIVSAPEESVIRIDIFLDDQRATGTDTEILWNEPGCFDTYQYRSEGRDIFLEAGKDQIFSQSHQIFLDGEHLIEVLSDAVASYAIRVSIDSGAP